MSEPDMRVGDSERDQTAALLSEHFAAGRLDHNEFDERTERALNARTRRELDVLFDDLPALPVAIKPATALPETGDVSPGQPSVRDDWRRSTLTPWAIFAVFFVILWAVTGMGFFWPVFPILGWGVGVAVSGVQAYGRRATSAPEHTLPSVLPPNGDRPHGPGGTH